MKCEDKRKSVIVNKLKKKHLIEPLSPDDGLEKRNSYITDESVEDFKLYNRILKEFERNKRVCNIAITGEYGVGKSSIIHNVDNDRLIKRVLNKLPSRIVRFLSFRFRSYLYVSLVDFKNIYEYSSISSEETDSKDLENQFDETKKIHTTEYKKAKEEFLYCFLNQIRSKYSVFRRKQLKRGIISLCAALLIISAMVLYSPSDKKNDTEFADATVSIQGNDYSDKGSAINTTNVNSISNASDLNYDAHKELPFAASSLNNNEDSDPLTMIQPDDCFSETRERIKQSYSFKSYINGMFGFLLFGKYESNSASPMIIVVALTLLVIALNYFCHVIHSILKVRSLKIKFYEIDASVSLDDNAMPIEKNCPEITHMLNDLAKEIKYTVVFDDMDRLGVDVCYSLLTKLREINHILNARAYKPIRFIYPLNNDVYEISRGTKFFDAVIPVLSRINENNAGQYLFQLINDQTGIDLNNISKETAQKYDIDADEILPFREYIGECFCDYRSVHQILNELLVLINRSPLSPLKGIIHKSSTTEKEELTTDHPTDEIINLRSLLECLSFVIYKNLLSFDTKNCNIISSVPSKRLVMIEEAFSKNTTLDKESLSELVSKTSNLITHMLTNNWLVGNEFYSLRRESIAALDKAESCLKKKDIESAIEILIEEIELKSKKEENKSSTLAKLEYYLCVCYYYTGNNNQALIHAYEAYKYVQTINNMLCQNICKMIVSLSTQSARISFEIIDKAMMHSDSNEHLTVGLLRKAEKTDSLNLEFLKWDLIGEDKYLCCQSYREENELMLSPLAGETLPLTVEQFNELNNKHAIQRIAAPWLLVDDTGKEYYVTSGEIMEVRSATSLEVNRRPTLNISKNKKHYNSR